MFYIDNMNIIIDVSVVETTIDHRFFICSKFAQVSSTKPVWVVSTTIHQGTGLGIFKKRGHIDIKLEEVT